MVQRFVRRPALIVPVLLLLAFVGCGQECDVCETDDDCAAEGLVCVNFEDGSKRCGSGVGSTTCRVR